VTLNEFLNDIYAPIKGISDRTARLYAYTIDCFGESLGKEPELSDLQELKIAKFLAHRVRTKQATTAAKDRAQIRALWEFAARRKLVDTWPTIPAVRVPKRIPEAWLTGELQRLLDAAKAEKTTICGIPGGLWWRAILLLCYDTGERIGAVLSLKWSGVRGNSVLFRAEDRKGRRNDILRDISDDTLAALLEIKRERNDNDEVFPWDNCYTYIWTRLKIILGRAKLPAGRKDKFHKIRKTTASYAEAAGLSAQRLLDHANPCTTAAYLDPRIVKQRAAPEVLPKVG
jgi:site-specific recombinase XerD